jgi:hypothetical protein
MTPATKWVRAFSALVLLATLAACTTSETVRQQAVSDPTVPGATGRTIIPGNNSTIGVDTAATYNQQKWQTGPTK